MKQPADISELHFINNSASTRPFKILRLFNFGIWQVATYRVITPTFNDFYVSEYSTYAKWKIVYTLNITQKI